MPFKTNLPIEEVLPQLRLALEAGRSAVLEAPPGAGKTTIVPLALLDEGWLKDRRIIMLEPRRLAARAAAMRMAGLLGGEVGQTAGYRTRLDSRVGPSTRIEVVTEGILTRFLQNDPSLEGIGLVIFDEFHERSIHADLGLALCLEARALFREDLRLLVMSATIDGGELSGLIGGAPVIKSTGRAYPVASRYLPLSGAPAENLTGPGFISGVVKAVLNALREETGSILVFLPGGGEIRRVESVLKENNISPDIDIAPLYGELSRQAQDIAIRPSPPGRRKVVLATSIAETSLTIEGVRVVIDSGLQRVSRFSPSIGMSRLETTRVTRASVEQRSGRAGRLEPGVSMRLWAEAETKALKDKNTPEILDADLAPLALELAVWGVADPRRLKWLDPPPDAALLQARDILIRLDAIGKDGMATGHGAEMAGLGLHPRLSHMVLKGRTLGLGGLACLVSALLAERDIVKPKKEGRDTDIRHRLEILLGRAGRLPPGEIDAALCDRVRAAAAQLEKRLGIADSSYDAEKAGLLLAFAYPERIAKRRDGNGLQYLLASGRGAFFLKAEPMSSEEYIVAASLDGGEKESRVFLAAPVEKAELERHFAHDIEEIEAIEWDEAQKGVAARRQKRLWRLILSDSRIQEPHEEKLLKAFISGVRQNGLGVLPWDKSSEQLRARINFLNRVGEGAKDQFPEFSDERLLESIETWLGPWVLGMTRLEHLKRLDMSAVVLGMLSREERSALDRLAPSHITVPSGSRVHIDYGPVRPVLAVRLQELFGLDKTPCVAGGKVNLVIHLLSPANRPVQVTEDLAGFWASSYPMVKKELKGRYPRHHWPDDPMQAEPSRGVKKRR